MLATAAIDPPLHDRGLEIDKVYQEQFDFVWVNLRRFGTPTEQLEDAVHDVFVVLHRRAADFDPARSSLRTWIAGVVRRVAADHRRSRQRLSKKLTRLGQHVSSASSGMPVAEARTLVADLLESIPEEHALIFVLSQLHGVPLREIAAELGINPNTAASRLRATRQRFAKLCSSADRPRDTDDDEAPPQAKARVLAGLMPVFGRPRGLPAFLGLEAVGLGVAAAGVALALVVAAPGGEGSAATATGSAPGALRVAAEGEPNEVQDVVIPYVDPVDPMRGDRPKATDASHRRPPTADPTPSAAVVSPSAAGPSASPADPPAAAADPPVGRVGDLDAEIELVKRARRAARSDDPSHALQLANDYRRRFPTGVLRHEMAIIRVDTLCRLGRPEDAARHVRGLGGGANPCP